MKPGKGASDREAEVVIEVEVEVEEVAVGDPGLCCGARVGEEERPGGQERALTPGLALESAHQRFRRESPPSLGYCLLDFPRIGSPQASWPLSLICSGALGPISTPISCNSVTSSPLPVF